ncbi:MAG: hypothetical protein KatS3mg051_1592 [Anaerolineae bacterium]|nr:MAG: hypothetical protein KatS3mg051_1592 [Anaerolineae bacterium]
MKCATQNDEPEDLVSVPVYGDASAGPGRTVHAEPLRYRQVTRDQYFHDFQQAPDGRRFAYWRVVGDSAVPIYFDQEEVPVEVLPPGTQQFKNDTVYVFRWMDDVMIKRLRRRPDGTIQAFSLNPGIPVYEFRPAEHDFEVLGRVIGPPKQQLYAALVARAFEIQREVWSTIAAAERGRGSDA